jgi:ribose/xylose/arabinose/galactoside ABC-type transport system permease subunit
LHTHAIRSGLVKAGLRYRQTLVSVGVFAIVCAIFGLLTSQFLTLSNAKIVLIEASPLMIVAFPATLLMIGKGFDLSTGSVQALSGVTAGVLCAEHGWPLYLGFVAAVVVGGIVGCINAVVIEDFHVNPMIATLGTDFAVVGAAYLVTPEAIIVGLPKGWSSIGSASFVGIPVPVAVSAVIFLAFMILLNFTGFGSRVYAIGGNEAAAGLAGINVKRTMRWLFILTGLCAGLGGVVLASRLGNADPTVGTTFALQVIAAVILGGTSFAGGEGRLAGTIMGCLVLTSLSDGLNLLGMPGFWQYVATGGLLIGAVMIDSAVRRKLISAVGLG